MLIEPRIRNKELEPLCRRLGVSLKAGVDIRKTLGREWQGHGSATLRNRMTRVHEVVAHGGSLAEGLSQTGRYFPSLFLELTTVGEQTGNLAEVLLHLADHYENQIKMRRLFIAAITWPMLQLCAVVGIIGLLILIMGILRKPDGKPLIDILGLGLVGVSGLAVYLSILGVIVLAMAALYQAMRRGLVWTKPLQRAVLKIPVLGQFAQTLALSHLAWSMHLTFNTNIRLSRALPLCLRSTHNAHYTDHSEEMVADVAAGYSLYEAFTQTGAFPGHFLDALQVGEDSGQLPESMGRLASQYRDQAQRMMSMLTVAGGFAVFGLTMVIIIGAIILIASQTIIPYIDTLNELSK